MRTCKRAAMDATLVAKGKPVPSRALQALEFMRNETFSQWDGTCPSLTQSTPGMNPEWMHRKPRLDWQQVRSGHTHGGGNALPEGVAAWAVPSARERSDADVAEEGGRRVEKR